MQNKMKIAEELIKNGHDSDRAVAAKVGCSQPTVTRVRGQLEAKGVIREYTAIPDLAKLGYEFIAFTFSEDGVDLGLEDMENLLAAYSGNGLGHAKVYVSVHRAFSEYMAFREKLGLGAGAESFVVPLQKTVLLPFSFSRLKLIP